MVLRMLRVAIPAARRGLDAAGHETEAIAMLHAVGGFQAYRRALPPRRRSGRSCASCSSTRAYPGLGRRRRVDALRGGADRRRRPAALVAAGAAARPADRRPGAPRRAPEAGAGVESCSSKSQDELELVDHDIDARYFASRHWPPCTL